MPFWNDAGRRARAGAGRGRPLPGGPPGQNGGANAPPSTRGGRPGSRRPDSRGRRPWRWPHDRVSGAGAGQRQAGSADSASHRAGTPQSGSGPPARGGPGMSRPPRPARLPSRSGERPSPQGGRAWSRRPCQTVATWTTWDGQRDLHFVSRQRWRDQPRPVHDTPGVEVPPPFLGHTLPPSSWPRTCRTPAGSAGCRWFTARRTRPARATRSCSGRWGPLRASRRRCGSSRGTGPTSWPRRPGSYLRRGPPLHPLPLPLPPPPPPRPRSRARCRPRWCPSPAPPSPSPPRCQLRPPRTLLWRSWRSSWPGTVHPPPTQAPRGP
ncbi:unnamed protein product, partial [Ixodes pacificus]